MPGKEKFGSKKSHMKKQDHGLATMEKVIKWLAIPYNDVQNWAQNQEQQVHGNDRHVETSTSQTSKRPKSPTASETGSPDSVKSASVIATVKDNESTLITSRQTQEKARKANLKVLCHFQQSLTQAIVNTMAIVNCPRSLEYRAQVQQVSGPNMSRKDKAREKTTPIIKK